MLLKSLWLKNIRSYTDQTIHFGEHSTLLSGDIGCGKSTLLLAIEFALFGISRPDLSADLLLRKGANQGSVELQCTIDNKDVIIKKHLKKEKDGIKQLAGSLTINNVQQDAMPIELKAAMIGLLGYPEDQLTKSKNYIFRYTIYTPQEEMKLILQDDPEIRLDVLRKIFNIDKYKVIRENIQIFLRSMRLELSILEAKTQGFEELKMSLAMVQRSTEDIQSSLRQLLREIEPLSKELQWQEVQLESLEKEHQEFLQLQQQQQHMQVIVQENIKRIGQLQMKEEQLKIQIERLKDLHGLQQPILEQQIRYLEQEKNQHLAQQARLKERMILLDRQLREATALINEDEQKLAALPTLQQSIWQLQSEIEAKVKVSLQLSEIDPMLGSILEQIGKYQSAKDDATRLKETIGSLAKCPTCLQEVKEDHRSTICREKDAQIAEAEQRLRILYIDKEEKMKQKQVLGLYLEQLQLKEKRLIQAQVELQQLQAAAQSLNTKKEQLTALKAEKENLLTQLGDPHKGDRCETQLILLKEQLQRLLQRTYLEHSLQEAAKDVAIAEENVKVLKEQLAARELELSSKRDPSIGMREKKDNLQQLRQQEKILSLKQAQLQRDLTHLQQKEQENKAKVEELMQLRSTMARTQELYAYLEQHFIPLTLNLERHMMLHIHYQFNQLFQEWFSMLVSDENMSARLDDAFAPIIEQNGYEVSFFNLSGGEKTSAALAYRLALNKVINDVIVGIKTKDLLILDEPTDGFSSEQLDKVRDVLERLNLRQIILVSHETKIESFVDNVIKIEKEGHVSRVVTVTGV